MKNEVRGFDLPLGEDKEKDFEGLVIGLGSESCVHEFYYQAEKLFSFIERKDFDISKYKLRIITPRIPQKYFEIIENYLRRFLAIIDIDSIIFNDYGLLHRMYNQLSGVELILGRTLVRGLTYVPWSELILKDETFEMQDIISQLNIMHTPKIKLLKIYGIKGVELCPTINGYKTIDYLHNQEMNVYVNYNNIIASVGRACPLVRMLDKNISNCGQLCKKALNIEFVRPGGFIINQKGTYNELIPNFKCVGNMILYHKNIFVDFPYNKSDGVIFDCRLVSGKPPVPC